MEPEDRRCIIAVNTRQRIVAVLVAVDSNLRHVPVHLVQQAVMGYFLNRPLEWIIISGEQLVNKIKRKTSSVMRDI
ncbi:hypothetical protein RVX78_000774 [Enterobacter cloacae]|nr:hypothetical protein [Enterobacter cloacae]